MSTETINRLLDHAAKLAADEQPDMALVGSINKAVGALQEIERFRIERENTRDNLGSLRAALSVDRTGFDEERRKLRADQAALAKERADWDAQQAGIREKLREARL
jgi:hypothetical protein